MKKINSQHHKAPAQNHNLKQSVAENNSSFFPMKKIIVNEIKSIENIQRRGRCITGVSTGFGRLDNLTSGLQRGNLIVVAARPIMGKTAFALAIARNAALDAGIPVAMFSMGLSKEMLGKRLLFMEAKIDSSKMNTGSLSDTDCLNLGKAANRLAEVPIFINDSTGISIQEIKVRSGKIQSDHNIGLIIIDYLQLMRSDGSHDTRDQEVSEICRSLKDLAKELNLPIVVLSQVSRRPEFRDDHRPCLGDLSRLSGSNSIEAEADVVLFIYRDNVYNRSEDNPERGMADIIVAKHRNGQTGLVKLSFDEKYSRFENLITIHEK